MSQARIEAKNITAGYGAIPVVENLSIVVWPGEIVGLLGPNGAGKSTTILTLAGVLPPLAGRLLVDGAPCVLPLYKRANAGLALVTEERSIFSSLSVSDNLRVARVAARVATEMFPDLSPLMSRRAGLLSGGEQQMLVLARALARSPRLLLADELSLGLAPIIVRRLLETVRAAADTGGLGAIVVEQHIHQILDYADRVYVMRGGRIVLEGPTREMRKRIADIERAYLAADGEDAARTDTE